MIQEHLWRICLDIALASRKAVFAQNGLDGHEQRLMQSMVCPKIHRLHGSEIYLLTHSGLEMPFGDINLSQYWFRWWLIVWRYQAITQTKVHLLSMRSTDNHLRAVPQGIPQATTIKFSLKITYPKLHPNFPRANELSQLDDQIRLNHLHQI